ncbi:hypothetical protein IMSHALPRED_003854 [Imshaugia aleurites]|uniref:Nucleoside phosphorylase domain-containing protein n=1 Tax=Imshaugia aleurites TaxID=172621 RepID=A0A8H3J8E4_9LECA|nr:hypothetical protein IMSHALPRED_003854 [Imshaugia aleurites]
MRRQDYTVGWICALQMEYVAAWELLEEEHSSSPIDSPYNDNNYTFGRIGDHHIVIVCFPKGRYGITSVVSVTKDMLLSFEFIRIGLMIGIGEGAPSGKHSIRLGDVVIDCLMKKKGSVVPYNFDKAVQNREFERTGSLNSPPTVLLTSLTKLSADHERKGNHIAQSVRLIMTKNPRLREKYQHAGAKHDRLYESSYIHRGGDDKCEIDCDNISPPLVRRPWRELDLDEPVMHYGPVASALFPRRWANGSISGTPFHKWRFCLVQGLCTRYLRNSAI